MQNKEEQQKDLEERVKELVAFAKEKEIFIGATQKISSEGYIETTPLFRDLKKYVKDAEFKTTSETSGSEIPSNDPEVNPNLKK